MTFRSHWGFSSRSVAGCAAVLLTCTSLVGCGDAGAVPDAERVDADTAQLERTAGGDRPEGRGAAVGTLGHSCSPSGARACAKHDQTGQLICGAGGVWRANGTCSAGNECDTTPGPNAGSCEPAGAGCSREDSSNMGWPARWLERDGRTPKICHYEWCVHKPHRMSGHWRRVCTGECTPAETECSGNAVRTCDPNGQWGIPVPCSYVCDAATGTCAGLCSPGAAQCSGNGVQICDASGQWSSAAPCVNQACDAATGTCIGVCTPGTTQCSGNGTQTCDASGQWGAAVGCVNQTCDAATGTCVDLCIPGTMQCSGNGTQTCDANGQWGVPASCRYSCEVGPGGCGCGGSNFLELHGTFASEMLDRSTCAVSSIAGTSAMARIDFSADETVVVFAFGYGSIVFPEQIVTIVDTESGFQLSGYSVCSSSGGNNQGSFSLTVDKGTGLASLSGSCGPDWGLSCAASMTTIAGTFSGTGQWCGSAD